MKVFLFLIAAVIAYFLFKMKSGGEDAGALSPVSSSKGGQLCFKTIWQRCPYGNVETCM